jgi:hypothetical protein
MAEPGEGHPGSANETALYMIGSVLPDHCRISRSLGTDRSCILFFASKLNPSVSCPERVCAAGRFYLR